MNRGLQKLTTTGYATETNAGASGDWTNICNTGIELCSGSDPNWVVDGCTSVTVESGTSQSFLIKPSSTDFDMLLDNGYSINDLYTENSDLSIHISYTLSGSYSPITANIYVPNIEVTYHTSAP